jgi:hypothetical protein
MTSVQERVALGFVEPEFQHRQNGTMHPAEPTDPTQLDLFAHSRDVMLCNDAAEALLHRDPIAAAAAQRALANHAPQHDALAALPCLIAALTPADAVAFAGPAEARAARLHLLHTVAPAARAVLGSQATVWLAPLWRALAGRAVALPFRVDSADEHATALWLHAGEAAAAVRAVQGIESWRRIPAPLAWMVQARHAGEDLDAVWPLIAELAWLAPARFAACAESLADPLLTRLLRRFDAEYEAEAPVATDALAWFPAWVLNDQPALLPMLRQAQPGQDTEPERAFRLMTELLGLERQGRHAELIECRKRLRGLQPALYAIYMRTR